VKKRSDWKKKGPMMSCLVCAGTAERVTCQGLWEERDCPTCGRYRMADALVLTLMEQGQIFDVAKTREWLAKRHLVEMVPCIESAEGLLII
jgi:hypothetical protein